MADVRKGGLGHDDVLGQAAAWKAAGKGVALATVVTTWGSSPRPVGSQMAIDDNSNMVGSVSGGCIEGAVVMESRNVIDNGTPRLLDFGVSNDMAWEVGLACGGKVEVYVERVDEPMYAGALKKALAAREAKAPLAVVTRFPDGLRAIVTPAETEGDLELSAATLAIVRQRLTDDRSGRLELAEGDLFVLALNPPKRLVLVGAVHISQSLVPMAQLAG